MGKTCATGNCASPEERHGVEILLGFFNPMESLVTHNLVLSLYRHLTAPEVRLYLARQIWEEANHTMAFEYVLKTLPVDRNRVFNVHRDVPAVRAKEEFLQRLSAPMLADVDLNTVSGRQQFLRNLVGYYIVLEGVFFYGGFLFAYTFRRRNLLKGLATIVDWTLKDESLHLSFGIHLISELLHEHPDIMTPRWPGKSKTSSWRRWRWSGSITGCFCRSRCSGWTPTTSTPTSNTSPTGAWTSWDWASTSAPPTGQVDGRGSGRARNRQLLRSQEHPLRGGRRPKPLRRLPHLPTHRARHGAPPRARCRFIVTAKPGDSDRGPVQSIQTLVGSSPILSVKSGLAHAAAFSLCDRSARRWSACCSRLRVSR